MSLLTADQLSLAFGKKIIFEEVSFAVQPGEKIALVGPNGSGKSTLLRIIAGARESDAGEDTHHAAGRRGLGHRRDPIEDGVATDVIASTRSVSHVGFASEVWGAVQIGVRRIGFFRDMGRWFVTYTSLETWPTWGEVPQIVGAMREAGLTGVATIDVKVGVNAYGAPIAEQIMVLLGK